ncbi:MAG: response regulator [Gemmatimonas sp.]|nr:response regulator [Gemmatimonas sp.]
MIPQELADCALLVVDDEEANLDLLEGLLVSEGYRRIARVSDAREVLAKWRTFEPDLILLDLHMPHRTGFELLADLRELAPPGDFLPVLVLTADATQEARDRALSEGARDFLTKPFDAVEVLLRVRNLLEIRLLHRSQREARLRAESAERRASLLAEASRVMSTSLDSDTALAQMANLLVREFADECRFLLLQAGELRTAAHAALGGSGPSMLPVGSDIAAMTAAAIEEGCARVVEDEAEPLILAPIIGSSGPIGAVALSVSKPRRIQEADLEMISDLAARTALAIENAQLFADAQLASRARERMLSVVAHDLRNPLAVVGMYSEMLIGLLPPDGDAYEADALASIHKTSRRMQQQIEDLLDISRLQHGTFSLRRGSCSIEALFRDAELLLQPLAESYEIELVVQSESEVADATARLDASRLQQVLSNLVGNALKFTPPGGRVILGWTIGDNELRGHVEDTGPGIARDQLPHVFSAYWQAREGDRRGIGLGLWISRMIVEAHGGRIWVDSVEGAGATFHFTVPLALAAEGEDDAGGRMTHVDLPLPS